MKIPMNPIQNPQPTKPETASGGGCGALGILAAIVIVFALIIFLVATQVQQGISQNQVERAQAQAQIEQARLQQEKELTERTRLNQESERHNAELRATNTNMAMGMLIPILGLAGLAIIYTIVNHRLDIQTMQREDHMAQLRIHTLQEEQKLLAMQMSQVYYLPKTQPTTINQTSEVWR